MAAMCSELLSWRRKRRRSLVASSDDATLLRVLNLTFLPALDARLPSIAASPLRRKPLTSPSGWATRSRAFGRRSNRVYAMSSRADRTGIDAALEVTDSLSQEIGQPFIMSWAIQVRCPQVLLLGDAAEAERLADKALEINLESGQPDAFTVYGANIAGVRLHQGRLDDFLPLIGQAAAENPGIPAFQAAYAQMLVECGRNDDARPLLDAARAADFNNEALDYGWITMTTLWADAVAGLDDVPAASVLYDRLRPYAGQGVTSGASSSGSVASFLGRLSAVLGRHAEAIAHFEHADAVLRSLRAPFWLARNQVDWAKELIARGTAADVDRAYDLLTQAKSTAATFDCSTVEGRGHRPAHHPTPRPLVTQLTNERSCRRPLQMPDALLRLAQLTITGIALSLGVAGAALPPSRSRSRHW